jgi:hypothetical protein
MGDLGGNYYCIYCRCSPFLTLVHHLHLTPPCSGLGDSRLPSPNMLIGITSADTMKIHVSFGNTSLPTLIDSGSTHSFIDTVVAQTRGLKPNPRPSMTMGVANGDRVACSGICHVFPLSSMMKFSRLTSTLYLLLAMTWCWVCSGSNLLALFCKTLIDSPCHSGVRTTTLSGKAFL